MRNMIAANVSVCLGFLLCVHDSNDDDDGLVRTRFRFFARVRIVYLVLMFVFIES